MNVSNNFVQRKVKCSSEHHPLMVTVAMIANTTRYIRLSCKDELEISQPQNKPCRKNNQRFPFEYSIHCLTCSKWVSCRTERRVEDGWKTMCILEHRTDFGHAEIFFFNDKKIWSCIQSTTISHNEIKLSRTDVYDDASYFSTFRIQNQFPKT